MRRFGWQIGGLTIAIGAIVALGILVFAHGPTRFARHQALPSATAVATATADPRVAAVEAAARRYVEALATSMRTGSPDELDSLSAPGSQAEGNAGVAAGIVQDQHRAFVANAVDVRFDSTDVNESTAEVRLNYSISGYDADWPSMHQRAAPRSIQAQVVLDLSLIRAQWLVDTVR